MSYPPDWRVSDVGAATRLMRAYSFAHFITAEGGLHATQVPFVVDTDGERPVRLRAHLNASNPQARSLDGADAIVAFSGPSTYVSPHWRVDKGRGGTIDYLEVQVRGRVRVVTEEAFFRRLIDDLSAQIEPHYADIGDYPVWNTTMAPAGYIARLFPFITPFEIEINSLRMVSKLHQQFPEADRRSVAEHLARSSREASRAIAEEISKTLA
jgi:transcriptional regulator